NLGDYILVWTAEFAGDYIAVPPVEMNETYIGKGPAHSFSGDGAFFRFGFPDFSGGFTLSSPPRA
ncbi:hypothetical protein, partial [Sphingobium herbicidovorans]